MKTEEFTDKTEFLSALNGKKRRGASAPRRAKGEGTGSRTSALDTLSRAGYTCYGYDARTGAHTLSGRAGVLTAGDYDALLDRGLREVRGL